MFHFSASVHGVEYIVGGETACQGVSAVISGEVIDQLIQTAEYEVIVTKEQFEMTKSTVTALLTGEQLPCDAASAYVQEHITHTAGLCQRQWIAHYR